MKKQKLECRIWDMVLLEFCLYVMGIYVEVRWLSS
jgi:hypothetical protein